MSHGVGMRHVDVNDLSLNHVPLNHVTLIEKCMRVKNAAQRLKAIKSNGSKCAVSKQDRAVGTE